MGETGCGKTRLIKYMCDVMSMNSDNKTLVIVKVQYNDESIATNDCEYNMYVGSWRCYRGRYH